MANIDVNQTNKHGEGAIHVAAGLGQLEILKVLATKGGNLGLVDNRGDSAVYWAARQGHVDVIQHLVSQGVHVNMQNKVRHNFYLRRRYLIQNIEHHFIILSLLFSSIYLLSSFFSRDQKTNQNGESCLHTACNYGHTSTVEYLTSIHTNLDLQDVVSLFFIFYTVLPLF